MNEAFFIGIGRYDRKRQTRKYIHRIQLIAAMGPPGGGRNVITDRLLTRFNVINMTFPTEKQIIRIYGTMLNQHFAEFHAEVKGICECRYTKAESSDFTRNIRQEKNVAHKIKLRVL